MRAVFINPFDATVSELNCSLLAADISKHHNGALKRVARLPSGDSIFVAAYSGADSGFSNGEYPIAEKTPSEDVAMERRKSLWSALICWHAAERRIDVAMRSLT